MKDLKSEYDAFEKTNAANNAEGIFLQIEQIKSSGIFSQILQHDDML